MVVDRLIVKSGIERRLAESLETVRANFAKYGLLDDRVVFLKGFFADTLPTAPIRQLAVLRMDADLYTSTADVLRSLYPKASLYVTVYDGQTAVANSNWKTGERAPQVEVN